jgi:hypothetical protein
MQHLAVFLMTASAALLLVLGSLHLFYTFSGTKFEPRDKDLLQRMARTSPVISRKTTMWKAWVGFNASHSFGAILFGLVYGQMAIAQSQLLFGSPYLLSVGFLLLLGYAFLGKRYWFSVPFRGISIALVFYTAAIFVSWD